MRRSFVCARARIGGETARPRLPLFISRAARAPGHAPQSASLYQQGDRTRSPLAPGGAGARSHALSHLVSIFFSPPIAKKKRHTRSGLKKDCRMEPSACSSSGGDRARRSSAARATRGSEAAVPPAAASPRGWWGREREKREHRERAWGGQGRAGAASRPRFLTHRALGFHAGGHGFQDGAGGHGSRRRRGEWEKRTREKEKRPALETSEWDGVGRARARGRFFFPLSLSAGPRRPTPPPPFRHPARAPNHSLWTPSLHTHGKRHGLFTHPRPPRATTLPSAKK